MEMRLSCSFVLWSVMWVILELFGLFVFAKDVSAGELQNAKMGPEKDTLPVIYMAEHCQLWSSQHAGNNYHIYIDDSAVVELTSAAASSYPMQCVVTFAARSTAHKLLLHFESIDINYNPGTVDRLHIFDGFDAKLDNQLSPSRGLYGKYFKGIYEFSSGGIHDYKSSQSALTLYFEGSPSPAFSGFRALFTVFKDAYSNGTCPSGYFKCYLSYRCIPRSLVCNSYPNCGQGDRSDLEECATHHSNHFSFDNQADLGLMVGCAISIVILMVVVLWLGIVCLKRTKFGSQPREYSHRGTGPEEVEGAVVEPVQPRNFLAPVLSFFEPPPLYSENSEPGPCGTTPSGPRFEPPPPYTVDDRDTAGLIQNESSEIPYQYPGLHAMRVALQARCAPHVARLMPTSRCLPQTSSTAPSRPATGPAPAASGAVSQLSQEEAAPVLPVAPSDCSTEIGDPSEHQYLMEEQLKETVAQGSSATPAAAASSQTSPDENAVEMTTALIC